jgi:sulfur carrier protein
MKIRVNGSDIEFEGSVVKDLLDYYKIKQDSVIIEKNSLIIHREKFDSENISDGDVIEIVSFVGGG